MHFTDRISLYPHQEEAVHWMMEKEMSEPSGGILAHDMGLGKTIDVLYYIASHIYPNKYPDITERHSPKKNRK